MITALILRTGEKEVICDANASMFFHDVILLNK